MNPEKHSNEALFILKHLASGNLEFWLEGAYRKGNRNQSSGSGQGGGSKGDWIYPQVKFSMQVNEISYSN